MKKTLACLAGLLMVPLCASAKEKDKKDAPAVPDANVSQVTYGTQVNDAPFDKTKLEGKVVVVEEWGVNCAPCIASLPDMAKLAKSGEKAGLVVVGLERQGGSKEAITKLIDSARVKYPVFAGGSAPAPSSGIPHACVFNAAGKLVWHGNPLDEQFEKEVKKAMRDMKADAKNVTKL